MKQRADEALGSRIDPAVTAHLRRDCS
jgi:hypothetical protein